MNKMKIDDSRLSAAIYTLAADISRLCQSIPTAGGFSKSVEEQFSACRREMRERAHRISDASVFTHTSEFVRSKTHARRKTWRRVFLAR